MARVAIERLSKIFRGSKGQDVQAVKEVSLTVEDRELLVLVGPSGCGKSTTLRLIAGLEEVSQGTISIDGRVINEVPPQDRDIAMVFQNDALYPHMTVYENLAFGLKLRKFPRPEIEKRVSETAEMLGLSPCLARYPRALSGGERQRVGVGRAMVRKPRVFLFDEPLSNLDAPLRTQMRLEISRLQQRLEATMIYVTHDQVEAMTLGDRVAVMKEGAIQQVAAPMQLYERPANLFVAGFIGSPGMNFFHGTILYQEDTLCFVEQTQSGKPGTLRMPQETVKRYRSCAGRNLILGLRPEQIFAQPLEGEQQDRFTATVELVEPMGAETIVHLAGGTNRFVARFPASYKAELHQKVSLAFDMSKAHFFDPATGLALS